MSSAFRSSCRFGREKFSGSSEIAGRVDGLELYGGFVFLVLEGRREGVKKIRSHPQSG